MKNILNITVEDLSNHTLDDQISHVQKLIESIKLSDEQQARIQKNALDMISKVRYGHHSPIQSFIHQYSLSTEEGIAIMCLAESLLRIPDHETAHELINDKLKNKNWKKHLVQSDSKFVKLMTAGLMITGKIIDWSEHKNILASLIKKMGEPVILSATKKAIKIISDEFIIGDALPSSLENSKKAIKKGFRFSYDILGESSRTQKQADYYYNEYIKAIESIGATSNVGGDFFELPNLSVKLTALHPKVMLRKEEQVMTELYPKLAHLAKLCQQKNITLSFDAEESYRQDIYLKILTKLVLDVQFANFEGIGFVIQGYQKRAFYIIDYLIELANTSGKKIPLRLVKGAYWDSEIKHAQENGLAGYPVFTKKEFTDVSYLACANKILAADCFYPQFATHNAQTMCAIIELSNGKKFEFQKLQGMGNELHDLIVSQGFASRIYAPVGKYEDLLAYLMRRLLENGANSSFVNMLSNKDIANDDIVSNPIEISLKSLEKKDSIQLPENIYLPLRKNSRGMEMGFTKHYNTAEKSIQLYTNSFYKTGSIIDGYEMLESEKIQTISSPANFDDMIGTVAFCTPQDLKLALDVAHNYFDTWNETSVFERAEILEKIAQALEDNKDEIFSLLIREAGKNIDDAIAEVREAIDFAYYYASEAKRLCGSPIIMPSYTGEKNELHLSGKGVFVCVSPWNFPLAIFCGQIFAALATGNTVITKPAQHTSIIAHYTIKLMHECGVPDQALQLVVTDGKSLSNHLLSDPRVTGVCFTGSTDTAQRINRTLAARDGAIGTLIAETGGQNAMIIDNSALLEQAADNIINSAFGSAGQRCSALRVAFIQQEIYQPLLDLLTGAMNELKIGNPHDLTNDIGPVISKTAADELLAHTKLIQSEQQAKLLATHKQKSDSSLQNGSYFVPYIIAVNHINDIKKENFGPILHVIPFELKNLDQVINDINNTGFGLTFGLQTRIQSRIDYIASKVKAGNFYANRTMIGAHVGTHPFGGENLSGTGFKAGGPHYLLKFLNERTKTVNTTAIGGNIELLGSQNIANEN